MSGSDTPTPDDSDLVPDGNPQPGAPPPPPFNPHSDLITDMEISPERERKRRRKLERARTVGAHLGHRG